jgi:hypothetical protein
MSELRIFSYLTNPRIWKATIAARLCGVEVEVIGASPRELQSWLWDFDAHPISTGEHARLGESATSKTGFKGMLHLVVYGDARITVGGAVPLLQRLSALYLGPKADFPPPAVRNFSGYITRITH